MSTDMTTAASHPRSQIPGPRCVGSLTVAIVAACGLVSASSAAGATVPRACAKAAIGGKSMCLAAGKACDRRYAGQYARRRFECVRKGKHGRYTLILTPAKSRPPASDPSGSPTPMTTNLPPGSVASPPANTPATAPPTSGGPPPGPLSF